MRDMMYPRLDEARRAVRPRTWLGITILALAAAAALALGAGPAAATKPAPAPLVVAQATPTTFPPAPPTTAGPATTLPTTTSTFAPTTSTSPGVGTTTDDNGSRAGRDIFRLNGDVVVGPDETVNTVVAMNGHVTVRGHVRDTVFAANGDILVEDGGRVDGDAVTLNGEVRTESGGTVGGDRNNRGEWARDVNVNPGFNLGFPGWFFVTLGSLGFGVLLALVAGRSLDSVGGEYRDHLGRSALVGFLALIGLPLVFIVLLLSLVGIPLALLLFPAVFFLGLFGLYALSLVLGRRLLDAVSRPTAGDLWAMVAGVLLIRVVLLIPVLGWLLFLIAGLIGFGAVLSRLWEAYQTRRSHRTPPATGASIPTAPPPLPLPPVPAAAPTYPAVAPGSLPPDLADPADGAPASPPAAPATPQPAEPAPGGPESDSEEPRFHI